jgi:hypothetical protein
VTAEWKHDTQPAIGAEIAALRNLTAEVTGDLNADERLIAVSWCRTGRKILTVYPWAIGLVVIAGGLYLILHQQWWLWAAIAILVVAGLATVVGPGAASRIPGYGVLLTDQQLILVRTSGSSPPRAREAPVFVPRGDVSATSGHGFFGTTVFLTLTTPVTATPLRLAFGSQYVPAATAIYLSLASAGAATSLRLPPPDGPALADSRTRAVLRRYRYGTWLVILTGAALVALFIVFNGLSIVFGSRPGGKAPASEGLFLGILMVSIGFISAGVFYRVRATRWHQVLSRCQWQEISYRYSEREEHTSVQGRTSTSWVPTLAAESLTEPGTSMVLSISDAQTRLGWWRLRVWRQAPTGVAWLAGDPSHRMIVAPPGPGRLFSAKHSSRTPAA